MTREDLTLFAKVACKALAIFIGFAILVILFVAYYSAPIDEIKTGSPYTDLLVRFLIVICVVIFLLGYLKAFKTIISKM